MKIAILFLLLISSVSLVARPVSYSSGWTVMSYNDYNRNSILVHYSPTSKYSVGYKAVYWQKKEYWLNAFNINYLAKRINKKKSQANIYLNTGLGLLTTDYKQYNNKKE